MNDKERILMVNRHDVIPRGGLVSAITGINIVWAIAYMMQKELHAAFAPNQ